MVPLLSLAALVLIVVGIVYLARGAIALGAVLIVVGVVLLGPGGVTVLH